MKPADEQPHAWLDEDREPVHLWFSLTYANYLVLHRTLMQSMPPEWQRRMVKCLVELDDAFDHIEKPSSFRVTPVSHGGRFAKETVPHYNRGRTRIEPRATEVAR